MACPVGADEVQSKPSTVANNGASLQGNKSMSENRSIVTYSDDISGAEAPAPLPVGQYAAEIIGAEVKTSANTGNDYYSVQVRIHADAYPADFTEGDPDGTVLTFNRVSAEDTPRGRYQARKFCEAIGAKTGKQIDTSEWIGLTCMVEVDHQEYEGEKRAQAKKIVGQG